MKILALTCTLLVSGCIHGTADECAWVRVIMPSTADVLTDGTKRQIVKHNLKVGEFCR